MDTGYLVLVLGYTIICVAAVFFLRQKYPHNYLIGLVLCFFAPAWGQIYVKSKYNWVPLMIFMSFERSAIKALDGEDTFVFWLIIGGLSAFVMYFRILFARKKLISSQQPTEVDKDQNITGLVVEELSYGSSNKLSTNTSKDESDININNLKTTDILRLESALSNKSVGWNRLWIVVSIIYLITIITVIILSDSFPKKRTAEEIKASHRIIYTSESDSLGLAFMTQYQPNERELQDIVARESKWDIKKRTTFISQMFMLWIFPCLAVYALGWAIKWVYKGFVTKSGA